HSFSFYLTAVTRDLHSFPTRRSSDLVVKCSITTRCRSFPMFTPLHRFRILQAEERTGAALLSIESRAGGPWWSSGPQSAPGFHRHLQSGPALLSGPSCWPATILCR